VEEAYSKIAGHGPILSKMAHPLKYTTFGNLVTTAFETEDDPYVADEFIGDTGRVFGFNSGEIRSYLNKYQYRFEMMKAG
jgi:hypothetical protein